MRSARVIQTVGIALMAISATGCVTALRQPMPDMKGRLSLKVVQDQSLHPQPLGPGFGVFGVYQIPDTLVFVSGHQGAARSVGGAFGIFGLLGAHTSAQATGEKKTQDVQAQLRVDMAALAERILGEELATRADARRFAPAGSAGDGSLEILPSLVVNFIGDDQVRLWIVLNTALKDGRGDRKWRTQYMVDVAESRRLGGESGWASSDGAPLRQAVDHGLRRGIGVLLKDASGGLPRDTGRTVKVKGHCAWLKEPHEVTAKVLEETEDTLIVVPTISIAWDDDDLLMAGVNIFRKQSIAVTPESTK